MISISTTTQQFQATYYYREELIDFCKQNNIPYSGLMKYDLEQNIVAFLSGKKPLIKSKIKISNWSQDRLALDAEVTPNYRSNQETRAFFESVIGKKFSFCGAMMNYKKNNLDKYVTYQDLVDIWYQETELKKQGKSTTEKYYKANRYNKFVKQFFADPNNVGRDQNQMIIAWQVFKESGEVNKL